MDIVGLKLIFADRSVESLSHCFFLGLKFHTWQNYSEIHLSAYAGTCIYDSICRM